MEIGVGTQYKRGNGSVYEIVLARKSSAYGFKFSADRIKGDWGQTHEEWTIQEFQLALDANEIKINFDRIHHCLFCGQETSRLTDQGWVCENCT